MSRESRDFIVRLKFCEFNIRWAIIGLLFFALSDISNNDIVARFYNPFQGNLL